MSAREHQPFGAVREGGCWGDGGAGGFPQRQERQAGKASLGKEGGWRIGLWSELSHEEVK